METNFKGAFVVGFFYVKKFLCQKIRELHNVESSHYYKCYS